MQLAAPSEAGTDQREAEMRWWRAQVSPGTPQMDRSFAGLGLSTSQSSIGSIAVRARTADDAERRLGGAPTREAFTTADEGRSLLLVPTQVL